MNGSAGLALDLFLSSIVEGTATRQYRTNTILYSEEDPADALYFVRRGEVSLKSMSPEGREVVVVIVGTGEFFGEECLVQPILRRTTAKVLTECVLTRIERSALTSLLRHHPNCYAALFECLVQRIARLEANLRDHVLYPGEQRLACALLTLANLGTNGKRVIPKMSQETLAQIAGMTRSRVCVAMNKFRDKGFVAWDRAGIEVRDSLRTVCISPYPQPGEQRATWRPSTPSVSSSIT